MIEESRRRYATPRAEVEEALRAKAGFETPPKTESKTPPKPSAASSKPIEPPPPKLDQPKAPPAAAPESETKKEVQPEPQPPPPVAPQPQAEIFEEDEFKKAEKLKTKIIQVAGALGFSYEEEKHLPDQKRIDLVLLRGSDRLAVELCVTTQAEHEVRNVLKCIQFGYDRIFHICQSRLRRAAISSLTRQKLSEAEFRRVQFLSYGEFMTLIKDLPITNNPGAPTTPRKTVPEIQAKLSPEEEKSEEARLLEELRRRLKRNKGGNPPNP